MFSFQSIGHVFAFALQKIHAGLQAVEKVIPEIQKSQGTVEAITKLIPGGGAQTATAVERVAFGVLGTVAAAVAAADAAATANGLNVTLDQEVVTTIKALIADFKTELQAAGIKV